MTNEELLAKVAQLEQEIAILKGEKQKQSVIPPA